MINYDERGVPLPGKPSHDYRDDLISVTGDKGPKVYLPAKDALRLARDVWPTAKISTTLLHYQRAVKDDDGRLVGGYAVVHVHVELPDGSIGDGLGSETVEDFRDYLEKAETKGMKRALTAAGIGVQFDMSEFEYEESNPRAYKGANTDAAPLTTRKPPTPISPAVGYTAHGGAPSGSTEKGEPVDVTTGEIAPTSVSHKDQDWLILLDDTVKTGKKAQVIQAWGTICRAEGTPSKVLQDRYKLALTQTT